MSRAQARRRLVVFEHLTLDGVMQAPGRPDEDRRDAVLNSSQKYVASRTLEEPLPWSNSSLLAGDAAEAVAALKEQPGGDLVVLGSGELVQALVPHGLKASPSGVVIATCRSGAEDG